MMNSFAMLVSSILSRHSLMAAILLSWLIDVYDDTMSNDAKIAGNLMSWILHRKSKVFLMYDLVKHHLKKTPLKIRLPLFS